MAKIWMFLPTCRDTENGGADRNMRRLEATREPELRMAVWSGGRNSNKCLLAYLEAGRASLLTSMQRQAEQLSLSFGVDNREDP